MSYTPIVQPADLASVAYEEILNEITRNDGGALATEAIATAIEEAQSYLGRFNLTALFGDPVNDVAATTSSVLLNRLIKNMGVWYLLNLANPSINYEDAKTRYDQAIDTLKRLQDVRQTPPTWPMADLNTVQLSQVNTVHATGRRKRSNNF